jgi:hypothetical protein
MRRTSAAVVGMAALVSAGFLASACMGESEGEVEQAAAPPTTTRVEVSPPSGFAAAATPFRVVLRWTPGDADSYTIYRNGFVYRRNLPASASTFTDATVVPGKTYDYEIEAVLDDTTSERVSISATTKLPPVREARLQGWFNLRARVLSHRGYDEPSERFKLSLRFRPSCPRGPCAVRWTMYGSEAGGVLRRRGARYTGTFTGDFDVTCGSTQVTSEVTLTIRVIAARPIKRRWRAFRVVGRLEHAETAQQGCVSAEASYALRGRFTR